MIQEKHNFSCHNLLTRTVSIHDLVPLSKIGVSDSLRDANKQQKLPKLKENLPGHFDACIVDFTTAVTNVTVLGYGE